MKWRNLFGGVCLAVLAIASSGVFGAAAEDLQQAVDLYEAQDYVQAQSLLQGIDPAELTDQQRELRAEYLSRVQQAARLQVKAEQDLADAEAALEAGQLDRAQDLFAGVRDNEYVTATQRVRAAQALQLIEQKRDLAEAAQPPADAAQVPAAPPQPEPATEPVARDMQAQREAALLVDQARELIQSGDYAAAESRLNQALQLVPNFPEAVEARRRLQEARLALPAEALVSRIRQTNRLQWDLAVRKYRDLEQQILQDVNNQEFDQARGKLLQARQVIAAARPYAESPEIYQALLADTESLDEFIAAQERIYNEQRVAEMYQRATQEELARTQLAEQTRQRQISELMEEAQRLYRERRFADAVETLKQVLAIAPNYELARWLKTDWEEMALHSREKEILQDMQRERQMTLIEADEAMIPWHVYVRYPDNWPEINRRQERYGAFQRMEDEATRAARRQLDETVPEISFETGVTFRDAIDRIARDAGLNIVVNWNALQQFGIIGDQEVALPRLTNVSWRTVLQLLLRQVSANLAGITQIEWVIEGGVLTISTREELSTNLIVRVYDIGDLLMPRLVVERGQGLQLGGGGGGGAIGGAGGGGAAGGGGFGGGGGGFGGGGGGTTTGGEAEARSITDMVDEIQELIIDTVLPTSWIDAGGAAAVTVWNDRVLIISQTPNGHEEIRQLLTQLREILSIQIAVEARFLTVSRNFLREIGVDLDVILNQGTAGYDRVFSGGGAVVDPGTGAPVLMPRTFTRTGVVPGVVNTPPWTQGAPMGQIVPDQPYGFTGGVPLPGSHGPQGSRFTPLPIQQNSINLANAAGVTTNVPGSFAGAGIDPAMVFRGSFLDNIQLDFLIRATEADRRSTILTAPRVVLRNTQEARVEVATLTAYVANVTPIVAQNVATGGATIATIPTGSSLWVQGAVSSDLKYVLLTLEPFTQRLVDLVSATPVAGVAAGGGGIGGGGGGVATFTVQLPITEVSQVITQVSVPDGGTLLMGGQKLVGQVEIEAGVPMLSHVPILNRLFTNRTSVKDEQTLLILVTPKILVQPEEEEKAFPTLRDVEY